MLLNTAFCVEESLTRSVFLKLAKEWLEESPFYSINLDEFDDTTDEYQITSADDAQSLFVGNYESVFVLQVTHNDSKASATYITNYVLDDKSERHMLHVSQERVNNSISLSPYTAPIMLPNLLKSIFWNEYGGFDNGLLVDNKAIIIRKDNIDLACKVVKQELSFDNPIVYVSPNMQSGLYDVNYDFLAQSLIGQAHVFVEGSPKISLDIKDLTDSSNPYNGAVKIYLPGTQQSTTLLSHGKGFNNEVIDMVRSALVTVGVPDKFNVTKLKQTHAFSKLGDDSELTKLFEDMLNDKDREIQLLKEAQDELKTQLSSVNAKAASLQSGFSKQNESIDGDSISFVVTETDMYDGERNDVILKILQKEYDAMKDDSNLSRSRKFDVISDVLEHNFPCKTDAQLIECIRGAFKDGALTREGIGRLQSAGFVVEKSGRQAHYKLTLNGDSRYEAVFPSTPSDKARGTKNLISDFSNKLFGF